MATKRANLYKYLLCLFFFTILAYTMRPSDFSGGHTINDTQFSVKASTQLSQDLKIIGDKALQEYFTNTDYSGKSWRSSFILEFEGNLTLKNTRLYLIIQNSKVHTIQLVNCCNVRIDNCELSQGNNALDIQDSDSIEVINTQIHDNIAGIHMENTNNSILHNNLITHHSGDSSTVGNGIYLLYCNKIELQNNIANFNNGSGIYLERSTECILENNEMNYNYGTQSSTGNGLFLVSFCDKAQIINNQAHFNTGTGQYFSGNGISVQHSDWSLIFNNSATFNEGTGSISGNGIYIEVSNEVSTFQNSASYNSGNGFEICGSIDNMVYHNNFSNNKMYGISMRYPWQTEVYENILLNNSMGNNFEYHKANTIGDNSLTSFEGIDLELDHNNTISDNSPTNSEGIDQNVDQKSIPSYNSLSLVAMFLPGMILVIQFDKQRSISIL